VETAIYAPPLIVQSAAEIFGDSGMVSWIGNWSKKLTGLREINTNKRLGLARDLTAHRAGLHFF